jgi:UDP-N-acetylglucosamine 2-epimerase (non-hydrolysing)
MMSKIKILSIFGTRPEATKMVPLHLKLDEHPDIDASVCVTAQHRGLLDQVLEPFNIKPQYDLDIMTAGQTLFDITNRVLEGLRDVLQEAKPDLLLVHGDTTTTFAASLAAFYAQIPVGHVEAGLRSYNKYQPYPEEINRKLTTAIADLHFAPTEDAREKLLKENVPDSSIYITGNTAIDMMKYTVNPQHVFLNDALSKLDYNKRVILMTAHRRENLGEPMENICRAVSQIMDAFPDTLLVWPVHPNPAVTKPAHKYLGGKDRVILIGPIDVRDLHNLMARSYLVLTDSGGLQEEAPTLNKPVIVLREVTERPEGLKAGTLMLAGTETDSIVKTVSLLLTDKQKYEQMANTPNPFGDGNAAERIVEAILHAYKNNKI